MSLRGRPIVKPATLPDGRRVQVRVGVADDSYIAKRELDTVTVELSLDDGEHLAAVSTVLDADQDGAAQALARNLVAGLESGRIQPTAAAIEPLADSVP